MSVLAALLLALLLLCVAFAVDMGILCLVRSQAQACADAAALAAAWEMVNDDRIRGEMEDVYDAARDEAVEYAGRHRVNGDPVALDANDENDPDGEIVFGRLEDPTDRTEEMTYFDSGNYNTVKVRVRCTPGRGNPVPQFFAKIIGINSGSAAAEAAAYFDDTNIVGYRATDKTGNASLLPFAVSKEAWLDLLDGEGSDLWAYDPETQTVSGGSDELRELKIFPGEEDGGSNGNGKGKDEGNKGGGITPGNFGTIDIGDPSNAAPDLWRQIREGISAKDLKHHGGELRLNEATGRLELSGDPGMTASMKDALGDVVGQARTVMLYSEAAGQGNNTEFTIVGFAGVRIVAFSLTGQDKYILVQPAMVVDDAAIAGSAGSSHFVGQPVRLVR
jgi:Flp pilus assembly protein TadG